MIQTRRLFGSLGVLGSDHADRLTRAFTGAGIGGGALTANRKVAAVTDATVAVDRLEAFQVDLQFASKIAFDLQFAGGNRLDDLVELLRREVLRPGIRVDVDLLEDLLCSTRADPVNVWQGRFDAFVAGNFYS